MPVPIAHGMKVWMSLYVSPPTQISPDPTVIQMPARTTML